MPLFLPESTSPSPGVCLAASGAQGDLHCRQTQVGSGIMLSQIAVAHLLSRPRDQTFCGVSVRILINPFKQSATVRYFVDVLSH